MIHPFSLHNPAWLGGSTFSLRPVAWSTTSGALQVSGYQSNTITAGAAGIHARGAPNVSNTGAGLRGRLEFGYVPQGKTNERCGWKSISDTNNGVLDYGFTFTASTYTVLVGASTAGLPSGSCTAADRFQVLFYNDRVEWLKSGLLLHTLAVVPSATAYAPHAIFDTAVAGGSFTNAGMSGQFTRQIPTADIQFLPAGQWTAPDQDNVRRTVSGGYTCFARFVFDKGIKVQYGSFGGSRKRIVVNGVVQFTTAITNVFAHEIPNLGGAGNTLDIYEEAANQSFIGTPNPQSFYYI